MKLKNKYRLLIIVLILFLSSLACSFNRNQAATTQLPEITISEAEADSLEQSFSSALNDARATGNPVTITVTESQVTSYVALRMQEQLDAPIQNPQIHFIEDKALITGRAVLGPINSNMEMLVEASVQSGIPSIEIESAKLGAIPVPKFLLNNLNNSLQKIIDDARYEGGSNFDIETLVIEKGKLTITGAFE